MSPGCAWRTRLAVAQPPGGRERESPSRAFDPCETRGTGAGRAVARASAGRRIEPFPVRRGSGSFGRMAARADPAGVQHVPRPPSLGFVLSRTVRVGPRGGPARLAAWGTTCQGARPRRQGGTPLTIEWRAKESSAAAGRGSAVVARKPSMVPGRAVVGPATGRGGGPVAVDSVPGRVVPGPLDRRQPSRHPVRPRTAASGRGPRPDTRGHEAGVARTRGRGAAPAGRCSDGATAWAPWKTRDLVVPGDAHP